MGTDDKTRGDCVFDSVKEEAFWRNYFYRVSLIKQSAQLTTLAAQQQQEGEDRGASVSPEDVVLTGQTLIYSRKRWQKRQSNIDQYFYLR